METFAFGAVAVCGGVTASVVVPVSIAVCGVVTASVSVPVSIAVCGGVTASDVVPVNVAAIEAISLSTSPSAKWHKQINKNIHFILAK